MPILAGLVVLIQLCFVIHAMKTGRPYWWIFIIMGFPAMGCIIYYFVEVFPGSRDHRTVHQAARKLVKALQPDADLKRRAEELEICGSVENRKAMAEECINHQMYDEAVKLYESCLAGPHQGDGVLLFGLARAAIEQRNWDKAKAAVARLKTDAPKVRPLEARLLEARVLQGRAENDAAIAAYRELIPVYVGLEARYRYAELLLSLGQHEAAHHMFDEVLKHAKRFSSGVEDEQRWAMAARQAIGS
jgi:hypothetical protein